MTHQDWRVRFAPSPTGHLHVGNARTALFNWLFARRHGGTLVLRIEDTDAERSTRASERAILDDLRWLGLAWDEGVDADGEVGPYRQSERLPIYVAHAARLLETGAAYHCFCSPEVLEADRRARLDAGLPPKYSGRCRGIPREESAARRDAGEPAVVRLRVPADREVRFADAVRGSVAFQTDVIGDPVLLRSDGTPAYNFAVVVDDHAMGITHVVRGEDHISNTPRQLLLYSAFDWTPPVFAHLSLVLGPDHAPLSKRHGATSVAEFREKGYLPEALANYLALIGWSPGDGDELLPLPELARRFDIAAVGHSAGVFDEDKLAWVNRHYLRMMTPEALAVAAAPFLARAGGIVRGELDEAATAWLVRVLPGIATSVDRLDQCADRLRTVFAFDAAAALANGPVRAELSEQAPRAVVLALAEDLAQAPRLRDRETFRAAVARIKARTGQKGRALLHPIRLALTGEPEGPELDLIVPAIDCAADLPSTSGLAPVVGCRERAGGIVRVLQGE